VNIRLLCLFQAQPDSYLWPESLARTLKVSASRLLRDLWELEEYGFSFEHVPNRGIRYSAPASRLCVDQIEWELKTQTIGRRIAVWRRTTSTNDLAARAAKSRSNHGLVILAEEQTAGRGRRHRRWHAPPHSSILMSVLLFPPESVRNVALLTSLAAVAVADVLVESLDLPARIKWPNDVRVRGLKVCGILVEDIARGRRGRVAGVESASPQPWHDPVKTGGSKTRPQAPTPRRATVIGIGVNVNVAADQFPKKLDRPASSLMILAGRPLDRSAITRSIIERLDHYYHLALSGTATALWKRWRSLADLIGTRVLVERAGGNLRGQLIDFHPPGTLSLRLPSGEIVHLPAEEVVSLVEL